MNPSRPDGTFKEVFKDNLIRRLFTKILAGFRETTKGNNPRASNSRKPQSTMKFSERKPFRQRRCVGEDLMGAVAFVLDAASLKSFCRKGPKQILQAPSPTDALQG